MIYLFKIIHTTNRLNLFNYIHITNNLQTTYNMSVNDLCLQLAEKEVERMKKEEEVIRLKIQIKSDTLDSPIPPSATDNTDIKVSVTLKDAPPPAAAGAEKPTKSKFKTNEICQKKLLRGFNDGECGAICAKKQKDKIIFSQCPDDATASGLCGKHHKLNIADGGLRCGRCDTEDFNGLTVETFGTDEFIDAQVKGHIQWVKGVIHNLSK